MPASGSSGHVSRPPCVQIHYVKFDSDSPTAASRPVPLVREVQLDPREPQRSRGIGDARSLRSAIQG